MVKGIAIILVAYGPYRPEYDPSWVVDRSGCLLLSYLYLQLSYEAFFFIAGLFVSGSIAKRGNKLFTIDKVKTILYPVCTACDRRRCA
jgi:hypothetical protein